MDYDSDFSDEQAEYTEEILKEFEENSEIKSVSLFKTYINKEPEFYSIHNISSSELLYMFKNPQRTTSNKKLTPYQYILFNDLLMEIFGTYQTLEYCNNVFNMIYNKTCI